MEKLVNRKNSKKAGAIGGYTSVLEEEKESRYVRRRRTSFLKFDFWWK
jgi:hypothetical protein